YRSGSSASTTRAASDGGTEILTTHGQSASSAAAPVCRQNDRDSPSASVAAPARPRRSTRPRTRAATDAEKPSILSAAPCAGRNAAADTSCGEPSACASTSTADAASRDGSNTVDSVSGAGATRTVTEASTASVPHEPAISFGRSYPVTFFTTRPPALNGTPSPLTAAKPRK